MTFENIPSSWRAVLDPVLQSQDLQRLEQFLQTEEDAGKAIFPPRDQRFAALEMTAPDAVRVVILGQDPYHGHGQAHGLAFSVQHGARIPPSLANIYKELEADLGVPRASHGNLTHWAEQGVLLLNNVLTVEAASAGSHQGRGWEILTDAVVQAVAARREPTVFILWGSHAQKKAGRVAALQNGPHLVLKAQHPSPLSAYKGFFGSKPFSQANAFLKAHGRGTIDWRA